MRVLRLQENALGKDYIVGDIHGCYGLLVQALKSAAFDASRDRLFSVGDTVDRGPESHRALRFLQTPWVHAVRGNHEDMFLDLHTGTGDPSDGAIEFATGRNGMKWWRGLNPQERREYIAAFAALPLVIEIATRRGTVGIVHAEVPAGLSWGEFTDLVERGDPATVHQALWGRERVRGDASGVVGVGRVFVGHTPQRGPARLGNVYYIDTGAVFGLEDPAGANGRLTFVDISCATGLLAGGDVPGQVDLRLGPAVAEPFGAYACSP